MTAKAISPPLCLFLVKISDIRLARIPDSARVTARVTWERSDRPPFELFFETDGAGREDLVPAPEAFATACALPARHHGERRLLVEGSLCPRLAEGLSSATALLRTWFGGPPRPLAVEASEGFRALAPRDPARSAVYITGGIDSTHLIHANRRDYTPAHPAWFADGISLAGNLLPDREDSPWCLRARARLEKAAQARNLTLIPVRTNVWELDPDLPFVTQQRLSSTLASAAHLFPGRWSSVSIASGLHVADEFPRGTHPLLDPLYSSSGVEVRHDPLPLTRFDRLRVLAQSGADAIDELIVCLAYPSEPHLNCGECEKCVRTMAALVALGRLADTHSFRHPDVTPEMIRGVHVTSDEIGYWEEIREPLAKRDRGDLVRAIDAKLAETRRLKRWAGDAGLKGQLRKLDRRLLGGRLLEMRRRLK